VDWSQVLPHNRNDGNASDRNNRNNGNTKDRNTNTDNITSNNKHSENIQEAYDRINSENTIAQEAHDENKTTVHNKEPMNEYYNTAEIIKKTVNCLGHHPMMTQKKTLMKMIWK